MKKLFNALRDHKLFLLIIIAILEIITIFPVLYGYFTAPPETYFDGVSNLAPGDFSLYLSYFEQVKQGNWFFEDFYTGEQQTANFFNPFFLFFGLIGKIFTLPNIATYHLARAIMIPIFIVVLLFFLQLFFKNKKSLYIAVIMIIFGSGVGAWIAPFFESFSYTDNIRGYFHWPMDLWVTEFNTFLTLYHNPLYIASLTLILLTFLFFIKSVERRQTIWSVWAGLFGLILFLIHPYHIPTIYAVSAIWVSATILKQRPITFFAVKHFIYFFLISVPAAIYQLLILFTDPIMTQRYHNTDGPPTVLWLTIISYGFLLIFAIPEILHFTRAIFTKKNLSLREQRLLYCFIWFIAGIILVYTPFLRHTRRLTEGLQIPLIIFAFLFFLRQTETLWYKKFERIAEVKIILPIIFLILFGASTMHVFLQDMTLYTQKHDKVYIPSQTIKGVNWLKEHTTNADVILTDLLIGNLIPGIAGRHVYIGHTSETAFYRLKEQLFFEFFSQNRSENFELKFLKENRIAYIFYTNDLEEMGSWRPNGKSYLIKIYENNKIAIYKVNGINPL